jgi:hypothetical protein
LIGSWETVSWNEESKELQTVPAMSQLAAYLPACFLSSLAS